MNKALLIAGETFLQFRRDRIFIPVFLSSIFIGVVAALVSGFTIEEVTQVYLDLGLAVFNITGVLIAVYWGSKIYQNKSLEFCAGHETLLSGLVSRPVWLLGRFMGLVSTLIVIACILTLAWLFIGVLLNTINIDHQLPLFLPFIGITMEWVLVAALTMLISSFSGTAVTFFTVGSLWVLAQVSETVFSILTPEHPPISHMVVGALRQVWNFNVFVDIKDFKGLVSALIYGVGMSIGFFSLNNLVFSRKDLVN